MDDFNRSMERESRSEATAPPASAGDEEAAG